MAALTTGKLTPKIYSFLPSSCLQRLGMVLILSAIIYGCHQEKPPSADEMCLIPRGEFLMGSQEERTNQYPAHSVYLDTYYIDQYEITNSQYEMFILQGGYQKKSFWSEEGWQFIQENDIDRPLGLEKARYNGPHHPVVGVSWYEADAYARWAKKRLPTEAEWEKAARGKDGRKYPWGNNMDFSRIGYSMANSSRTLPVGSFSSGISPYGLQDCAGNVSEWVADRYDRTYYSYSPRNNPTGPKTGEFRVLRGGAWGGLRFQMQCVYRASYPPDYRGFRVGFRCARDPE